MTAVISEGCSTNECRTALQPTRLESGGGYRGISRATSAQHASHLQWQMTAASSCSSSSLFLRFAFKSFTRSCTAPITFNCRNAPS